MQLNFETISFGTKQPSLDCDENFVLLRNGATSSSPILNKYCNRTTENLQINETASNSVYVTFYALKGLYQTFTLAYKAIRLGCTDKINLNTKDDIHTIQSPNYPNPPPGAIECDWTISAPASTSIRIDFTISNTNIPCNLSEQAISLYNGGSAFSSLLIKDCPRVSSVISTENMMHVNYITNGESLHAAFQAKVQIAICGGTYIIRNRNLLKSKNYPAKYLNNLNCKYYFKTQYEGFNLEFRITKLDLANNSDDSTGHPINNTDCEYAGDFIEIRDTDEDGLLLGKYCGSNNNNLSSAFKVVSYSDHAFVQFKTDSEGTSNGFLIEISMLPHKCGFTISNATKGLIKSENLESEISSDLMKSVQRKCKWEIIAPLSNRIELVFKRVSLKSDPKNRSACIDSLLFYSKPVR